ncbi:MAG: cation:proton antiporter [Planctomycetaceae bacterium]|nr:cation:proton antiporter [Planctomycetaceae bacterium]
MLDDANTLLILGVVLVAGTLGGAAAKRLNLPSVTGQIIAGILMGSSVLGVLSHESLHRLDPLVDFALGLMAVAVGSHLNFRRLKVAYRRLFLLLILEGTLTPLLVYIGVIGFSQITWSTALLLSAIAVSTAPATVLAIVKETNSKGAFVTTLLAAVALNNLMCIILFELARTIAKAAITPSGVFEATALIEPLVQVGKSLLLGTITGGVLIVLTRHVVRSDRLAALSLTAILLTAGLTAHLGLSVLLACLCFGVTLANVSPDKEEIGHRVFESFELAIFAVFFTVAGMELKFETLAIGGLLAVMTFVMRALGKIGAGWIGMKLAGATKRIRRWIGVALIPQAGLAVGLMLLITEDQEFVSIHELFLAVVLTMVLLNETVGPVLTRISLRKSGDFGRDRARVLDFLSEHNITVNLAGPSKEEAVRQLVSLAVSVNKLSVDTETIVQDVMKAEGVVSTCVGEGLALPHARLDEGTHVVGAMGISHKGLNLDTPDGRPVHCMVLILTPKTMPERHLQVLSALAFIAHDESIQSTLYHIDSPTHAEELLHLDEQFEGWNHYLEED